jgi:hypothetical protein
VEYDGYAGPKRLWTGGSDGIGASTRLPRAIVGDALSRERTRTPVQLKAHTWRGQSCAGARFTGFLS